jgi:hypothetical protein
MPIFDVMGAHPVRVWGQAMTDTDNNNNTTVNDTPKRADLSNCLRHLANLGHIISTAADEIDAASREIYQATKSKNEANERIAELEKALTRIRYINHGPDKASGEWRCMEAAQIARDALEKKS